MATWFQFQLAYLPTYYANVFAHTTYCAQDLHNQYLTLHVCGMSKINHNDKQTSHLIDNIEKTATTFAEKGIFVHKSSKSKHLNLELPHCVSGKCRWKPYTMGLNSKKTTPLLNVGKQHT